MKLSVSQIGWQPQDQESALAIMSAAGFCGLEIAPTMVAGPKPYTPDGRLRGAAFAAEIKEKYGLAVSSMQSIWYGVQGSMFGPERDQLLTYTKDAVLFAAAAGADNMVFGCPKNRILPEGMADGSAVDFFREIGDYASQQGTLFSLEANPADYGTNFMNTTAEAYDMVQRVASPGCRLNVDFGTLLMNGEDANWLRGKVNSIGHVHISEPQLARPRKRAGHMVLADILRQEGYTGYVSIEMRQQPPEILRELCTYVREVFG